MEGAPHTARNQCCWCPSSAPLIYIGWRGGVAAKGAPQVGGILLGLGSPSRTPHLVRPLLGPASSSLAPLYTGAGGTPWTHLIYDILAVCGAPLHQITPR